MGHIGYLRLWSLPKFTMGLLIAFLIVSGAPCAARGDDRTLTVTVDQDFYSTRELELLADQVHQAARSDSDRIEMGILSEGLHITVHDQVRDKKFLDALDETLAHHPEFSASKASALSFKIGYSERALSRYGAEKLHQDAAMLDDLVKSLRPTLPGVTIERQIDGAIVRAKDATMGDQISKLFPGLFVVTPLSNTSWRVTVDTAKLQWRPVKRLQEAGITDLLLQRTLADPLDLDTSQDLPGVRVTVPNPEHHDVFLKNLRDVFGHDPDFVLEETNALIVKISLNDRPSAQTPNAGLVPPKAYFDLSGEIEDVANPPVTVTIAEGKVHLHATDAAYNADRIEVTRRALAKRNDLVLTREQDNSLAVSLAPGAHLLAPVAPPTTTQLEAAIESRMKDLKLPPVRITSTGEDRATVHFRSKADADTFRQRISDRFGLSIRLVDEELRGDALPPSHRLGDERLPLAEGGFIWVKPKVLATGDMIADATVTKNEQTNKPVVQIRLTDDGRALMNSVTSRNVGRRLAIIGDGMVLSAPVIRDPGLGKTFEISGNFTPGTADAFQRAITAHKNDLPLKIVDGAD